MQEGPAFFEHQIRRKALHVFKHKTQGPSGLYKRICETQNMSYQDEPYEWQFLQSLRPNARLADVWVKVIAPPLTWIFFSDAIPLEFPLPLPAVVSLSQEAPRVPTLPPLFGQLKLFELSELY